MEEAHDGVERIGGDVSDVVGGDARRHLVLGAFAPIGVELFELHDLEVDVDADLLEALLQELVHRQREHLSGAALGDHERGLERLLRRIAGLGDQPLGFREVVFDLEARMAEPRARRIDLADRGLGEPVEQSDDRVAVDREVERLAQPDVGPGRARQHAQVIIPDVRRHIGDDLHAGRLELGHRVGRRRLDQVDLAREQRVDARQRLRNRNENQPIDLGNAGLVPIVGVLHELGALTRNEPRQLEGPGARRLARELLPVAADLLVLRRARHQEPEHLVRKDRVDLLGGDLDRVIIDLAVARDRGQAGLHLGALALVVLRRLLVEHLVEIPDHRIGVEAAAVVELHVPAQRKAPLFLVARVDAPFRGQAGNQLSRSVGDVHLPGDERIVDGVAGKLIGAGAAVGLPGREWNVRERDGVADDGFRLRRSRPDRDRSRERQRQKSHRNGSRIVKLG